MEEVEKTKSVTKQQKNTKENKTMHVYAAFTIRDIVKYANTSTLPREDIVSILKENGQFLLIYYK